MYHAIAAPTLHAAHSPDAPPVVTRLVPCNPALLKLARARSVLLLQGPVGPFFDRLATWLQHQAIAVGRVVLQAGDRHDCRVLAPIEYTGDVPGWPGFLERLMAERAVDCLVLFGQSRVYHQAAIALGRRLGVPVVVLEEGYVRPGYVTMELDGVNGYSQSLSRYQWSVHAAGATVHVDKPGSTEGQFGYMAWSAIRHYWAMYWKPAVSKRYQHHKSTNIWHYSHYWTWSWLKKQWRRRPDEARVRGLVFGSYFFVPLQHEGDAQIKHHSPYAENAEFITQVLSSFARHAPPDVQLVFRQHPHSRGGPGHAAFIDTLAHGLGVGERVVHLVEGHTPTLVKRSRGVVLINSTVGLQALMRRKPLAVLGDALYKQPGLCFHGPLDHFWTDGQCTDDAMAGAFLEQLIGLTQAPCNVYAPLEEPLLWTAQHQER